MLVLAAVLILAALGIWLYSLFEVISANENEVRHLPKLAWFLIVLLGFDVGAIAWLAFGRRRGFVTADVTSWPPEYLLSGDGERREPDTPAPVGPDDDPEFLRQLDRRLRGDDPA
jgi:hypothetical protein